MTLKTEVGGSTNQGMPEPTESGRHKKQILTKNP